MNLPSALRHSKTHRAAAQRRLAKLWKRYELSIPCREYRKADDAVKAFVVLPPGAVWRFVCWAENGFAALVHVDMRADQRLVAHLDVRHRDLGYVQPPRPGPREKFDYFVDCHAPLPRPTRVGSIYPL